MPQFQEQTTKTIKTLTKTPSIIPPQKKDSFYPKNKHSSNSKPAQQQTSPKKIKNEVKNGI